MDPYNYPDVSSSTAFAAPAPAYAAPVGSDDEATTEPCEPRGILKSRRVKPTTSNYSSRDSSSFFCPRRLRMPPLCARRQGKRVTFRASVEVTEYSKALAHDGVPADGTDLGVGLGRPTWNGLIPLARKSQVRRVEECAYLPVERRAQMLMEEMGHKDFLKVAARHCQETAQVIKWRKEAMEDSKEPLMYMPPSYKEARDRALKVAAEVQAAAADSEFHPSIAMASWAGVALVTPSKVTTSKSQRRHKVQAKIPSDASASLAADHDPRKPSQRSDAFKRKRPLSASKINLLRARKAARIDVEV